jgi:hypothetical protein
MELLDSMHINLSKQLSHKNKNRKRKKTRAGVTDPARNIQLTVTANQLSPKILCYDLTFVFHSSPQFV